MKNRILALSVVSSLAFVSTAAAIDYNWTGDTDTDWGTATNWNPNGVPNLTGADNANVNGVTVFTPGGDFALQGGSTLTIQNGGNWSQTGGIAWIQAAGGILTIESGGTFDTGTAENINRGAGTTFNVSGVFNVNTSFAFGIDADQALNLTGGLLEVANGDFIVSGNGVFDMIDGTAIFPTNVIASADTVTFSIGGGTVTIGNEFKPNAGIGGSSISGGAEVSASLVSFDGGTVNSVDIGNGRLNISNGAAFQGIFSAGGDDYLNLTSGSSEVFIDNLDEVGRDLLLVDGRLRFNDEIGNIDATALGNGYLFSAIPEPGTYAMIFGLATLGFLAIRRRK